MVRESFVESTSRTFEEQAAWLRSRGEKAAATTNRMPSGQVLIAISVSRDRGDWQRELVVLVEPDGSVDAMMTDEEQEVIAQIGAVPPSGDPAPLVPTGISALQTQVARR